jgi:translation initiation factor 3 subunit F
MIDRVQVYIQSVLTGETEGDVSVGRYLLETLSTATDGLESGRLESLFNSHLQVRRVSFVHEYEEVLMRFEQQDTLMISYLANLVRSQAEVSTRLTLVT